MFWSECWERRASNITSVQLEWKKWPHQLVPPFYLFVCLHSLLFLIYHWMSETRFVSEKLDGVRAYWDGHAFLSRQNNQLTVIKDYMETLPTLPIDGELWTGHNLILYLIIIFIYLRVPWLLICLFRVECVKGRNGFEEVSGILHSEDFVGENLLMGYHVYDLPASDAHYNRRLLQLNHMILPLWTTVLQSVQFSSNEQIMQILERQDMFAAEGLIARDPQSPYIPGRTACMLKIKVKNIDFNTTT